MSDSPPTPAAGPPTALDIIPDMLTWSDKVRVSQSLFPNCTLKPPYTWSVYFGTHSCCTCWFCITLAACKQNWSWILFCSFWISSPIFVMNWCCGPWTHMTVLSRCILAFLAEISGIVVEMLLAWPTVPCLSQKSPGPDARLHQTINSVY